MRILVLSGLLAASLYGQTGFGGLGGFGDVSRMRASAASGSGQNLHFTPWLTLMGSYDRSFDDTLRRTESSDRKSLFGLVGVSGGHRWARTLLTGGYAGNGQYLKQNGRQSRLRQNHVAHLSFDHAFSPRLSVNLSQLGGAVLGGYGLGAGLGGFGAFGGLSSLGSTQVNLFSTLGDASFGNPSVNGLVDTSLLDYRTNFSMSSGSVNYRTSSRWTLGASGGASFVRRSGLLNDLNIPHAGAHVIHHLDERTAVQVQAGHVWITYPNRFGGIRSQSFGLGFSRQLTPRSILRVSGGVFDIRSSFIGRVAIDPEIAAILGSTAGYETRKIRFQTFSAGLNYSQHWGRNHFTAILGRGMIPGTDMLLAGYRDLATVSLGRTLAPRFNVHTSAMGAHSKGVVGLSQKVYNYQTSAGFALRLAGQLWFNANLAYRIVEAPSLTRMRGAIAMAGLTWTPREWGLAF